MGGNPTKLDSYHGGSASGYGSHSYAESCVNSERRRTHSRYTRIGDDYSSLDQVTEALTQAGLESSNLIVGIDFTKSNEWTGARSFDRKSLHHLGDSPNPYEQAISIIGRTIAAFDEDNLIPCYGFGDATTHDQEVFSFYPDDKPCNGFEEALSRYRELVPQICLSGPTSFAPMIETATTIVDASGGQYHVLLIIADGQVTQSAGTKIGKLSSQEQNTINAIAKASEFPLSIVLVGVGDGPWDMMQQFDDNIPCRTFDNFQFVNFTEIMSRNTPISKKEAAFALAALMEIPSQYKATIDLHLLGCQKGIPGRIRLPPPIRNYKSTKNTKVCHTTSSAPTESNPQNKICPACLWNNKDLAFGCGHKENLMLFLLVMFKGKRLLSSIPMPNPKLPPPPSPALEPEPELELEP
ncbi:hypothetical protein TEA_023966 [Camellia sinensis var. sinensis]|uniref:VWFA domain-containing protein n=1 Tax=Camellia sinensis var. sinensis TaxID=542762 RepID=A0A4S4CZM8_CAMSN|nr:hypothetical protein TEA_023966 [Camellia sinensis var. sinensis]